MAKSKTVFFCRDCGGQSARWAGKCPHCGEWDTLTEEKVLPASATSRPSFKKNKPQPISEVDHTDFERLSTGLEEFDRILGGGLVPGGVVLLGGDPGIGKSTLLLQALDKMSRQGQSVLYVSAEESTKQLKLRAERLGALSDELYVAAETEVSSIIDFVEKLKPAVLVIDSIQMVYHADFQTAPGTVGQVRESANQFVYLAKKTGMPVVLVGHITKEGSLAGPKTLEHMVDTVLYFEGDKYNTFRLLRAVKNRFGPANEIGVFEMTSLGLETVPNPSEVLLSHRGENSSGAAVVPSIEGSRALLLEVQALVSRSNFGTPNRRVTGADNNRVAMILAVLEKRCGFLMGDQDVFVNVVGGMRIDEPAADLAIMAAIVSSFKDVALPHNAILIGELGLGGEVRGVSRLQTRLSEAYKLGFETAYVPAKSKIAEKTPVELIPVPDLETTLDKLGL